MFSHVPLEAARSPRLPPVVQNTCNDLEWCFAWSAALFRGVLRGQSILDPLVHDLFVAIDALGVGLEQDVDGVAGPVGDLGGVNAGVESEGHAGVPEVVRPRGQRQVHLVWRESEARCSGA